MKETLTTTSHSRPYVPSQEGFYIPFDTPLVFSFVLRLRQLFAEKADQTVQDTTG